jgi:hypothetical protein
MKNLFKKLKLKRLVELLIKNTLTQIIVLGSIMVVSAILSSYSDIAYYSMLASTALLSLIAVTYILFAWVINPIIEIIKKIRNNS